ncbi:MAG TPA: hypothetical protein VF482_22680 [Trebonia sp.]
MHAVQIFAMAVGGRPATLNPFAGPSTESAASRDAPLPPAATAVSPGGSCRHAGWLSPYRTITSNFTREHP